MAIIAKVLVVTYVDGKRTEIPPGDEVPGLTAHDVEQLKTSGAVEDTDDTAADGRARREAEDDARRAFEAERAKVIAARESSAAPEAPADTTGDNGDADKATPTAVATAPAAPPRPSGKTTGKRR